MIRVQVADFHIQTEYEKLFIPDECGAIVTFVGRVREFSTAPHERSITLEHYPGMTEKVLTRIANEAKTRWRCHQVSIIHRIGTLNIDEQIVFVGVSAKHRQAAFDANQFVIDTLKTEAPFWKKEGGRWVDAKQSDDNAALRWMK